MATSRLVFRQTMSPGLRCFIAVAGLFCFFPTYDLLIRPGVPVLQLGMLPMWIIVLGAGTLGALLLVAAILGLSRKVVFDAQAREMRELGAGSFGLRFQRRHAFADLGAPSVRRDESSDGPTRFEVIVPHAARKRPIVIETYADEPGASDAARRIAAVLASA
jgi:hypothetical protein